MSEWVIVAAVARNGVIGRGGALPWRLTGGGNSCRNSRFQPYQYSAGRFCRCERKTLAESGRDLDNRAAKRVFTRARR